MYSFSNGMSEHCFSILCQIHLHTTISLQLLSSMVREMTGGITAEASLSNYHLLLASSPRCLFRPRTDFFAGPALAFT